jgi:hypothetical protein
MERPLQVVTQTQVALCQQMAAAKTQAIEEKHESIDV